MARLSIDLPDDLQNKAETRAAEGGLGSVEEYVKALIRNDSDAFPATDPFAIPAHLTYRGRAQLESKTFADVDAISTGMTPEDIEELRRQIMERWSG